MEKLLVGNITTKETEELKNNSVTIIVSADRFKKIIKMPPYPPGFYGVLAASPEVPTIHLVNEAARAMQTAILVYRDQYLKTNLTPDQYHRALIAFNRDHDLRFVKAPRRSQISDSEN